MSQVAFTVTVFHTLAALSIFALMVVGVVQAVNRRS
jgi:hypothetical protein